MLILGIETSCDETASALVRDGVEILSNVVASSVDMHKKTGGIIPEQAAREQIKCILPVVDEAMAGYKPRDIDAVAVTYGPGLIGSLLVGIETAKTLAYVWKKPIVPVNHLIGHIYANFVHLDQKLKVKNQKSDQKIFDNEQGITNNQIILPAMVLIVSGGHTELILMTGHGKFKAVGSTRDDAAGEAFDKIARLLGFSYPGGPSIQKAAMTYQLKFKPQDQKIENLIKNEKFNLPRPMFNDNNFDFSFSGLKTAVFRNFQQLKVVFNSLSDSDKENTKTDFNQINKEAFQKKDFINFLAYQVQEAITDVLIAKTIRAAQEYRVKTILLAGGVAANQRLRAKLIARNENLTEKFKLSIPPTFLCTDNAVSIASAAFFNYKPVPIFKVLADSSAEI